MMHKLVDLQNFSLYFDTNTTLIGNLTTDEMSVSAFYYSVVQKIYTGHYKKVPSKWCLYKIDKGQVTEKCLILEIA